MKSLPNKVNRFFICSVFYSFIRYFPPKRLFDRQKKMPSQMSQLSQPRKFSCKVSADSRRRFGNMFVVICHSHVCSMILNKVNSYLKCTELIVLAKSSNCILNQMKWYQNTSLTLYAIKIPFNACVKTKMAKMVQPPFLLPFSLFFMKTRRGTNHLSQTPQAFHR